MVGRSPSIYMHNTRLAHKLAALVFDSRHFDEFFLVFHQRIDTRPEKYEDNLFQLRTRDNSENDLVSQFYFVEKWKNKWSSGKGSVSRKRKRKKECIPSREIKHVEY